MEDNQIVELYFQRNADAMRTRELENMGLRVIRICNLDIDNNLVGVSEFIRREVEKSLPSSDEEGGFCESKRRKER